MNNPSNKEIAKEIRSTLSGIPKLKLSVTSNYHHIDIRIMEFNYEMTTAPSVDEKVSVNQYSFMEDSRLTKECKTVFQLVDEIIQKYHWDKSDSMTDYFHCAFYYSFAVGKWDKAFKLVN